MLILRICLAVSFLFCQAGCTSQSPTPGAVTPSLIAPSPTLQATGTPPPTATRTALPTEKATLTTTVVPTATNPPGPTATFDTLRVTPPTLMLHKSNPDFDAVAFLKGFVEILKEKNMHIVTYMDISREPEITAAEQGRLLVITIDDVSLQAKIDPSIQQMIAILREAGYPAVLGIVTEGKMVDEETAAELKKLASEGWELAMHTENHTDLHVLEQTSSYGARLQIRTCSEKITKATGIKPITLVLPYGNMVENLKILYRENVVWVVGIVGGEKYRTTNFVYYVGREAPNGGPEYTFNAMMARFNGK